MVFMRFAFFLMLVPSASHLFAQLPGGKDYFRYPLNIPPRLNANFGEMRPNHFHMGLDLFTERRENLPVIAPADGYIARLKIETGGFGRAIYINHPNGTTTLYAHMNRFIPQAESYLKDKQYEQRTWKIDLNLPAGLIQVKKGQLIGYSGNTGASQGPHVHFEIRDTRTENCLNPLLYDFSIPDNNAPDVYRLAFYDRDKSVYEQSPVLVPLLKKSGVYQPAAGIQLPFQRAFLAVQATDRMSGIPNPNGIYSAALRKDGQLLTQFIMNDIGYDKTRYLNGHIDHVYRMKGGAYLQMLFPPRSYELAHYQTPASQGHFDVPLSETPYQLEVADAYGNRSLVSFSLVQKQGVNAAITHQGGHRIVPGQYNIIEDQSIQFVFNERTFYDAFTFGWNSLYANGLAELSPVIQTYPDHIPVHENFTLRIKPNRSMSMINSDRVVIKRSYRGKTEIKKAVAERGWFSASFRDLGFFQLLEDDIPPVVTAPISNGMSFRAGSRIVVDVSDNNKFIRAFDGFAGTQWLMFQPMGNRFVYTVDEHLPIGEHKLTVVVYDEAGNSTTREWTIKRI